MANLVKRDLMDEMFDYFLEPINKFKRSGYLKTDIRETKKEIEMDIECAGCKKDEIKVSLKNGYLYVSVEKNNKISDSSDTYIRKERYYENTSRSFYVGESYNEDEIKCKYLDGVLKITLPKRNENYEKECKYLPINWWKNVKKYVFYEKNNSIYLQKMKIM